MALLREISRMRAKTHAGPGETHARPCSIPRNRSIVGGPGARHGLCSQTSHMRLADRLQSFVAVAAVVALLSAIAAPVVVCAADAGRMMCAVRTTPSVEQQPSHACHKPDPTPTALSRCCDGGEERPAFATLSTDASRAAFRTDFIIGAVTDTGSPAALAENTAVIARRPLFKLFSAFLV